MDITITIPDEQWKQFQEVAQEAVELSWDGSYEDFATYIMSVNIETYIKSQQKKQEKKMKQALASYEASMAKETEQAPALVVKPEPVPPLPKKSASTTNKGLAERISQLRDIPADERTQAQVAELNNLLNRRKNKAKKKQNR
jgi:hypothetical protein